MTNGPETDIRYLKGIGEKRAALFHKLGVFTVGDLLTFFPRTYEDWTEIFPIGEAPADRDVCVRAVLLSDLTCHRTRTGKTVHSTTASDGRSFLTLSFFNNKFISKMLKDGDEYLFFGRIRIDENGQRGMISPVFAPLSEGGCLRPVYPQTENLTSKTIMKAVRTALDTYGELLEEPLPAEQLGRFRLTGIRETLEKIHFPENAEDIRLARRRLVYEELLILQLGLLQSGHSEKGQAGYILQEDGSTEFEELLPYRLTNAQKRAIGECIADMKSGTVMRRLVQGDVGSGKTAVAASLIYTCIKNGCQCALMAPTEALANQHYKTFTEMFDGTGIKTALLTGSVTAKNKKIIKEGLASGDTDLVIGTHAVITDDVRFARLALTVTDEQHRFGVSQRAKLREKGQAPHVLVMSATPIPRTLSLIIYGDLDISVLDEKPAGRREIKTYRVDTGYRERLYTFIKKEVNAGRQCYIVCPLVEENPDNPTDRTDAAGYAETLSKTVFSDLRTGLLHGKMRPREKEAVMKQFRDGEIDILICTVVVEVGIDVPNATLMIIENAECFGLSQLHQLRGRVGRGDAQSYCVLVSDTKSDVSLERLSVLCETNDGFRIADEDLKMRGPGDFFGSRQSGLPLMKTADLMTDSRILYAARDEAEKLLLRDPALTLPENAGLQKKVSALFADIS